MTPTLTTSRIMLAPYTGGMVAAQHVAWLNDPEVVRYSEQRHKTHTLESQEEYLDNFPDGSHIWLIVANFGDPDDGECGDIGTITAYIDRPNRLANMGIMIGEKRLWGQGYGSEAWDAVIDFLFTKDNIRKIECGCMLSNRSMTSLADRAGMRMEACLLDHFLLHDRPAALITFGLLAQDMYKTGDDGGQSKRILGPAGA